MERRGITGSWVDNSLLMGSRLVNMSDPSSQELRKGVLRLASENPEFLEDLRPLLEILASDQKALGRRERMSKMMEFGGRFGVLSAFVSGNEVESKIRQTKLITDLNRLGYRKITPILDGPSEQSLLVQNMLPQDLFTLGRKYDQDNVLFKGEDGVIGIYNIQGAPTAEVGVNPTGDPAFQIAPDPSLYTRTKDMSFDFGFLWADRVPWDGTNPVDRVHMRNFVERGTLQV